MLLSHKHTSHSSASLGIPTMTKETRDALRRLTIKLCFASGIVPQALLLTGFVISNGYSIGGGGFADIYQGTYRQIPVALKRLRVFQTLEESKRTSLRKVCLLPLFMRFVVANIIQGFLPRSFDLASAGPPTCPEPPWCERRCFGQNAFYGIALDRIWECQTASRSEKEREAVSWTIFLHHDHQMGMLEWHILMSRRNLTIVACVLLRSFVRSHKDSAISTAKALSTATYGV